MQQQTKILFSSRIFALVLSVTHSFLKGWCHFEHNICKSCERIDILKPMKKQSGSYSSVQACAAQEITGTGKMSRPFLLSLWWNLLCLFRDTSFSSPLTCHRKLKWTNWKVDGWGKQMWKCNHWVIACCAFCVFILPLSEPGWNCNVCSVVVSHIYYDKQTLERLFFLQCFIHGYFETF